MGLILKILIYFYLFAGKLVTVALLQIAVFFELLCVKCFSLEDLNYLYASSC